MTQGALHIDLREGFENDEVVIRIGEKEVFRKQGVTTLPQVGRADGIDVPVEEGPAIVRVEIPQRRLAGSFTVPAAGIHLGISIEGGQLSHELSPTPFRYA